MQHLRISSPHELTSKVLTVLRDDPAVTSLSCVRGASLEPDGDVVEADVAREAMNDVVDRLRRLGVHRHGTVHIQPVVIWLSQSWSVVPVVQPCCWRMRRLRLVLLSTSCGVPSAPTRAAGCRTGPRCTQAPI